MNAEKERMIARWVKEYAEEYLSDNLEKYSWREVNGTYQFDFVFRMASDNYTVSADIEDSWFRDDVTEFEFITHIQNELRQALINHFFERLV